MSMAATTTDSGSPEPSYLTQSPRQPAVKLTGPDIHVIGKHAYAFSGVTGATTAQVVRLSFKSGNYYFVGRLTCNGSVDTAGIGNGNVTGWTLSFNGIEVSRMLTDTAAAYVTATPNYNDIIIPPYTEVEVTSISDGNDANRQTSCVMTGRIYAGKLYA